MTVTIDGTDIRLTHSELRAIQLLQLTVVIDASLLQQIKRIVPATDAGYSEWRGAFENQMVWIRWHWYFDYALEQFVIPPHGITTNATLISASTGTPLPPDAFARFALRRIRRRTDWQPAQRSPAPVTRTLPAAAHQRAKPARPAWPAMTNQEHRDGTARWAQRAITELMLLPETKQFGQIAKLARERFGFNITLAVARSAHDSSVIAVEENHSPAWSEIYQREQLVMIDPRLLSAGGAWAARARRAENIAFWNLAIDHGIGSGWLMRSADGLAAFVVSRESPDIAADEMQAMEANLIALATFTHALMLRQLPPAPDTVTPTPAPPRILTPRDLEIIGHMKLGRGLKEIAALMDASASTINRRVASIKEILGVKKSAQIVDVATKLGVLTRP